MGEDLVAQCVDALLELDPADATALGDHRYDDRLADLSEAGVEHARHVLSDALLALDQVDDTVLDLDAQVELEILRNRLAGEAFARDTLREHSWNPLLSNPGTALYVLLARDFAPLPDRLRSLRSRLAQVPQVLADARSQLDQMPRVHVETAIAQLTGCATLIAGRVADAFDSDGALHASSEVREAAHAAVLEHVGWLRQHLDESHGDPRLGHEAYAAKLWHTLDAETSPDEVLVAAEQDLVRTEGELARTAAELLGERVPPPDDSRSLVARALAAVAADAPVDDTTVLPLCSASLTRTADFVVAHELVTVPDDPVEIIEMPEIHRGVAVAYCDPPGPLEARTLPTFFAVSPTPADWSPERVASFYREYNGYALHNVTVHEAMPGHVLQLAHARRCASAGMVRRAFWSGPFVEGWAVYAEWLMADRGYSPDGTERGALAVRLQQLKMSLRTTINAILDVRVHTRGMTEQEAMRLMVGRGHQEEGEAVGKWRRVLLTSTQLPTYYVGWQGVHGIVHDLRLLRPAMSDRELHDAVLAHGSPPPRHLRTLLGI